MEEGVCPRGRGRGGREALARREREGIPEDGLREPADVLSPRETTGGEGLTPRIDQQTPVTTTTRHSRGQERTNEEDDTVEEKVKQALDEIRPNLQADGGDVEFVEVSEDGVVKVRLQGACAGCPMSQMTLKQGIETFLKEKVPEVTSVESA
jgi:Fe-S cluster biogenesis protein NfuA